MITNNPKVVLTEVHNKDGDLTKIIATDQWGEHAYDFLWTEGEPNTPENRAEFRAWVSRFLENKGLV